MAAVFELASDDEYEIVGEFLSYRSNLRTILGYHAPDFPRQARPRAVEVEPKTQSAFVDFSFRCDLSL